MKKYSSLTKLVFCATILMSTVSFASDRTFDNPHENNMSLKQVVEEDYTERFLDYRKRAIEHAQTLPAPRLAGGGLFGDFQNTGGWASAIENYKQIMHINPLPGEETWPIRGFVKQYNLHLITVTEQHIQQQKDALLKQLEGQ